jgi:ketosteroid isomerase-like protein
MDLNEIRFLKHTYCSLCDADYKADELAALFIEDGVWEAPDDLGGRHAGRADIRTFFQGMSRVVSFSAHTALNERITMERDIAFGRWTTIIPATFTMEGKPVPHWIFGGYEDEFVRIEKRGLFKTLRSVVHRVSRQDPGWS